MPAWDSLSADEQRLCARMMEVFAGFLTHTDAQVARVLDFIAELGELDNTIVLVMSDNGASAEGGAKGSFNEQYFFNFVPESLEENLQRIDDLGTPRANNHYPWGWAWAGNTPLKRFKRDTHEGGVADPLIVHWPAGLGTDGDTRHQYVHAIDVMPTLLDLIGIEPPAVIAGVEQTPDRRRELRAVAVGDATRRSAHVTQYYEMLGSRALYHDGWKAVVFHPHAVHRLRRHRRVEAVRRRRVGAVPRRRGLLGGARPRRRRARQARGDEGALVGRGRPSTRCCRSTTSPAGSATGATGAIATSTTAASGRIPEAMAPNLRNRSFTIAAELSMPPTTATSTA